MTEPRSWTPKTGEPVWQLIHLAVKELTLTSPDGTTEDAIASFLSSRRPRLDGRPWASNLLVAGDYAVWSDTGEICNPSTDGKSPHTRFLVRVRGESPIRFRLRREDEAWELQQTTSTPDWVEPGLVYPDEVESGGRYIEGATRLVLVNAYERDPRARAECLRLHGRACAVYNIDFGVVYGAEVDGLIHVHHLHQLADVGGPCEVDPAIDLIPICPNCHAVIHARPSPYTPEEVRQMRATASAGRRVV